MEREQLDLLKDGQINDQELDGFGAVMTGS